MMTKENASSVFGEQWAIESYSRFIWEISGHVQLEYSPAYSANHSINEQRIGCVAKTVVDAMGVTIYSWEEINENNFTVLFDYLLHSQIWTYFKLICVIGLHDVLGEGDMNSKSCCGKVKSGCEIETSSTESGPAPTAIINKTILRT